MKRFLAALRFLTVFPIPGPWGHAQEDLAGSVPCFPLVGLLLGAGAGALALGLSRVLSPPPACVLVVIALLAASGGLHMDGLSDTADGFFSARRRERMLEIMRDSHIGAMGVMAIVCVLLLKVAALASIPQRTMWRAVFLMPVAGRCALVVSMAVLPYARTEGGLAAVFYTKRPRLTALWAAGVLAGAGGLILGVAGLVAAVASLAIVLLFAVYTVRKIGGATGDTLGAACEIAEIVPALTLCGMGGWMNG